MRCQRLMPHRPWQRVTNESTSNDLLGANGLVRHHFPWHTSMNALAGEQLQIIED